MFRSGRLTRTRLNQIMRRAEATPHNLRVVAKACLILPQDLLAWFAAGQDPRCTDPLMVELAWRINELRADVAARNYARIEAAASGGTKRKTVTKVGTTGEPSVEEHVEDVLPAAWAIEKIDELAAASHWEISPDAEQAEELRRMMAELTPTPLLSAGSVEPDPPARAAFSGPDEPVRDQAADGGVHPTVAASGRAPGPVDVGSVDARVGCNVVEGDPAGGTTIDADHG